MMKTIHLLFLLLFAVPILAQTSSGYLDNSSNWQWEHDDGTPETSTGQLIFDNAKPSLNGSSTEFLVAYSNYGGERFHQVFGYDSNATYFIYDACLRRRSNPGTEPGMDGPGDGERRDNYFRHPVLQYLRDVGIHLRVRWPGVLEAVEHRLQPSELGASQVAPYPDPITSSRRCRYP